SPPSEPDRPYLATQNSLVGTGAFASQPVDTTDYRQGYLCGIIRGYGHVGSYSYERPGRVSGDVHRFRLALADLEALRRARDYLDELGVQTDEFAFPVAMAGTRPMTAIRTQARARVERVREVIRWPWSPSDE